MWKTLAVHTARPLIGQKLRPVPIVYVPDKSAYRFRPSVRRPAAPECRNAAAPERSGGAGQKQDVLQTGSGQPIHNSPGGLNTGGAGLGLVVPKSARLRFRLPAKAAPAPLLLLPKPNPLRWASVWAPPAAALSAPLQDSPGGLHTGGARLG